MIDISTLKEYIKVLEESSLVTLELCDETDSIRLEKAQAAPSAPAAVTVNAAPVQAAAPAAEPEESGKTISAPIVGVFYAAPSPESDPYVHVGKKVKKGDVVCIIEARKCMNEIQAEEDGEITAVLATNGELVEYNQPLFAIK